MRQLPLLSAKASWDKATRLALDLISDPVFLIHPITFRLLATNNAARTELHYTESELEQMGFEDIAVNWEYSSQLQMIKQAEQSVSLLINMLCKDRSAITFDAIIRITDDLNERVLVLVCKRHRNAVEPDADWLTGLAGRAVLERRLQQTVNLTAGSQRSCAVLFVDLDGFKAVNDTWGHSAGDVVLRTVAQRLSGCIRPTDLLARYGGDEFMVVVRDVHNKEEVELIAARMKSTLEEVIEYQGRRILVSASVGIAIGAGLTTAEELIEQADRAMYREKARRQRGQDCVLCDGSLK
jgi:diguanylate cyclase (GGDEF)-like protein